MMLYTANRHSKPVSYVEIDLETGEFTTKLYADNGYTVIKTMKFNNRTAAIVVAEDYYKNGVVPS